MLDRPARQPLSPRFPSAVGAIEAWLSTLPGDVRPLTMRELNAYRDRYAAGWRLSVTFPTAQRDLHILVDDRFPRTQPRIALAERPPALSLPHVDNDGVLCLLPDASGTHPHEPLLVVQHVLSAAVTLLEEVFTGEHVDDFRHEFLSYWAIACDAVAVPVQSLVRLGPPTRVIRVWRGTKRYVAGDDDAPVLRWIANLLQDGKPNRTTDAGLFLWVEEPLLPREYPQSGADMLALVRRAGGAGLLANVLDEETEELLVLLGAPTLHGHCLAGISLLMAAAPRWPGGPCRNPIHKGFRPGNVPKSLVQSRVLGSAIVRKTIADRVDAAWVHGRGLDPRQPRLHEASVAILGCGSIGSEVAILLAKSGVGRMVLIDPDLLAWPNVGRHALGAGSVNRPKAEALAERISKDFPHMVSVHPCHERWEQVILRDPATIESCAVIVSTIGDWAAEGALNEWHNRQGRKVPVVYGWTEAHAVAGHAVAIVVDGGCLQCGMDSHGRPLLTVADWPENTLKQEPACGAYFQPYGALEVGNVVNLVAELALDSLLGRITVSTHRTWVARQELLAEAGGWVTEAWTKRIGGARPSEYVEEGTWGISTSCRECQQTPSPTASAIPINI